MKRCLLRILRLNLKSEYWQEIKDGIKHFEYRERKPYWEKRLEGRSYDLIHLCKGYPKKDDWEKIIEVKWNGFLKIAINHEVFKWKIVDVYAIDVTDKFVKIIEDSTKGGKKSQSLN